MQENLIPHPLWARSETFRPGPELEYQLLGPLDPITQVPQYVAPRTAHLVAERSDSSVSWTLIAGDQVHQPRP